MIFPVFNHHVLGSVAFRVLIQYVRGVSAPLSRARAPLEPRANSIPVLAVVRPVEHGGDALPELHPLLLSLLLPLRGQLQQALGQVDIFR